MSHSPGVSPETEKSASKGAAPLADPSGSRVLFLDNLRIGLIVLVVLHHVAMAYGAAGLAFYYVELPPTGFSKSLLIFVLGNQAWFMGAFFLVAGYFTPGSFDRKGAGPFLGSRLLRLGVPLLFFALVLNPLVMTGGFFMPDYLNPLTRETYRYMEYIRMGPMWFVAMLLIFSFGYALWRTAARRRPVTGRSALPSYRAVAGFTLLLAGVSYLLRMRIPVGQSELGFPSLAYFPQYLSFFVLGAVAFRRDWLRTLPGRMGWIGFAAAAAATVFLFPLAFSGHMFSLEVTEALGNAFGDGYWQSAVYALWDSTLAVGLCFALIVLLRRFLNRSGGFDRFLARHSYAVYVVHIPIVVFLAVALRNSELEHTQKLGLVAAVAVPLCFGVAYLVRKIPFVSRIL